MIGGQINMQDFIADVIDRKEPNLKGNGEIVHLKILSVKCAHTGLRVNLIFTQELFEKFADHVQGKKIIPALSIPPHSRIPAL